MSQPFLNVPHIVFKHHEHGYKLVVSTLSSAHQVGFAEIQGYVGVIWFIQNLELIWLVWSGECDVI